AYRSRRARLARGAAGARSLLGHVAGGARPEARGVRGGGERSPRLRRDARALLRAGRRGEVARRGRAPRAGARARAAVARILHRDLLRALTLLPAPERRADRRDSRGD